MKFLRRLFLTHTELALALKRIEDLEVQLNASNKAHAALHRRSEVLRKEWPDVWKRYFTRAGEAQRKKKPSATTNKAALK